MVKKVAGFGGIRGQPAAGWSSKAAAGTGPGLQEKQACKFICTDRAFFVKWNYIFYTFLMLFWNLNPRRRVEKAFFPGKTSFLAKMTRQRALVPL
ncbi:MAG: hypothetical protein AB1921_17595 [Thermodesulfobacteriota bacterium]